MILDLEIAGLSAVVHEKRVRNVWIELWNDEVLEHKEILWSLRLHIERWDFFCGVSILCSYIRMLFKKRAQCIVLLAVYHRLC